MEQHMLSEKYNNQSWRSSLDDLDSLPGEEKASTGVSWNKLNARLQVTAKKNKRTLYLWLAAACVVISFFTVVFVSTFKQPTASSFAATKTNNKTASPNKKIEKTIVSTNTAPDHNTTITIHTNLIHSSGKKKNKVSNDVFTATQDRKSVV